MTQVLACLTLLASAALGPAFDVSVAPRELTIGDRAELTLSVKLTDELPDGAVSWPQFEEQIGTAEVLDIGPVETTELSGGGRVLSRTLAVTFFEVGEAIIPPIGVEVATASGPNLLTSEEVRLDVRSVLPEDEAELEAKPPAPPRSLAVGERFWWTAGALLATCLAALVLLARQTSEAISERRSRPLLTPREELTKSLEQLRRETDTETIHAGVSMTTRRYLGRLLDFPAPESTTSEVARELRRHQIDADVARRTGRLLSTCDMVMFARREVDIERSIERIGEVEAIADDVDSWLQPRLEPEPDPSDSNTAEPGLDARGDRR